MEEIRWLAVLLMIFVYAIGILTIRKASIATKDVGKRGRFFFYLLFSPAACMLLFPLFGQKLFLLMYREYLAYKIYRKACRMNKVKPEIYWIVRHRKTAKK